MASFNVFFLYLTLVSTVSQPLDTHSTVMLVEAGKVKAVNVIQKHKAIG